LGIGVSLELRELIRRMARENPLWGQQRIQAELAELGFTVCARTVAKYMRRPWNGHPCSQEIIHARVTANPTAEWLAQQLAQTCDVDRKPVKAPKANAIAERWIRTARSECLDHRLVLGHQHLQRLIDKYVAYYNEWRPHRSLEQRAPLPRRRSPPEPGGRIVADPILGGLHHVYRFAA
jgi:hypothetical protein